MDTSEHFTFTQAARMLGMTRDAVSNVVKVMGMTTSSLGLPGRGRWLTMPQIEEIAGRLGIEIQAQPVVSAR
jgi:hypothetical protein